MSNEVSSSKRHVYVDRREVAALLLIEIQTESVCEKAGGGHLVARRHDGGGLG
jgi:hypothetical protein